MGKNVLEINDDTFKAEVLESDIPVLVDFWAPWCGPCKAIGPVIEELAESYGDQIKFTKCNVDNNQETPVQFGVKAIPTLIFFNKGENVYQHTGIVAKTKLEEKIKELL